MKRIVLIFAILVVFLGTLVMTAPLGLFLGQAGLSRYGIGWGQSQGTFINGRINGLFTAQQAVGDVKLAFRPISILAGGIGYDMEVGGAGVRGTGKALLRPGHLELDQLRLRQKITAIEGLDLPVRSIGGEIRLIDASLVLDDDGCRQASGAVSSDLLTRAAAQYGKTFGPIAGQIGCEDGLITASLSSDSPAGDRATLDFAFGLGGELQLRVDVLANDPEIAAIMSRSGFLPRDDRWVYEYPLVSGDDQ